MNVIQALGWAGNACFFGRFLMQWRASERAGRSVTPESFWWVSLAGAILFGSHLLLVGEPVLLLGVAINGAICARNLRLARRPGRGPGASRATVRALAVPGALLLVALALGSAWNADAVSAAWIGVSAIGQALWSSRFLVQWYGAERTGEARLSESFWWISLAGNALLLAYAFHQASAVLVAGYLPGPLVQGRNLVLHRRERARLRASGDADAPREPGGSSGAEATEAVAG